MAKAFGVSASLGRKVTHKGGRIVLCPSVQVGYKAWPQARWDELASELGAVFARGDISIPSLTEQLASASLVIAVDSGPAHLADSLGVPVIGLYAATSAITYGPYNNLSRCICRHREASDALGLPYDSARHLTQGNAMNRITVKDVLEHVRG